MLSKLEKKMEEKMGPVVAKMDEVLQEIRITNEILRKINRDMNEHG